MITRGGVISERYYRSLEMCVVLSMISSIGVGSLLEALNMKRQRNTEIHSLLILTTHLPFQKWWPSSLTILALDSARDEHQQATTAAINQ